MGELNSSSKQRHGGAVSTANIRIPVATGDRLAYFTTCSAFVSDTRANVAEPDWQRPTAVEISGDGALA